MNAMYYNGYLGVIWSWSYFRRTLILHSIVKHDIHQFCSRSLLFFLLKWCIQSQDDSYIPIQGNLPYTYSIILLLNKKLNMVINKMIRLFDVYLAKKPEKTDKHRKLMSETFWCFVRYAVVVPIVTQFFIGDHHTSVRILIG